MTAPRCVIRLGDARADVADAATWLTGLGAPAFTLVGLTADVPDARRRFGAQGGMAAGPFGSQALIREVIAALQDRRALEEAPETVVLVVPRGFHPHVWHPRDGGVALGRGRWVRRYAVVPDGAPRGHIAHELGHLWWGWPDLHLVPGLGNDCLMAGGTGDPPSPPCAALRVAAGWTSATPIDADEDAPCWSWSGAGLHVIGERRDGRVLATAVDERGRPTRAAAVPADGPPLRALRDVLRGWARQR